MKRITIGLGICLYLCTTPACSQTDSSSYFQAQNGIANGNDIRSYAHLSSHPLYPDLAASFYLNHLDRDVEIIDLFSRFYTLSPIKKLHNRWIEKKYDDGDYATLIEQYFDTRDEATECRYRSAQLALGHRKAALKNIYWTWMSSQSVSPLCDPVFYAWDGVNTPEHLLKRAKMAYHAGNGDLARRLAIRLPSADPNRDVLLRFAGYLQTPKSLNNLFVSDLTNSQLARELLPTALLALVRIDSSRYARFALQFSPTLANEPGYQAMLATLTNYLANRDDPQAKSSYVLLNQPNKEATEALLRYLVSIRDWGSIRNLIHPDSEYSMALYWLGRALEADGKNAKAIYQKAAQTRSYYGFLAADRVGLPYVFNKASIRPSAQQALKQNRSLIRAQWLAKYGDTITARREIVRLSSLMSKTHQRQLAYWLNTHGFHFEAIYILGQAKDWNDIDIRFPTPYNAAVHNASQRTGTVPTWIYAIMRQESSMNPNAISRAKAKGLMQLIPSTARRMANQEGLSLVGGGIFNPMINTQLGAAYLATMFYRYNNMAMASAAYNAGPGRVDQWMLRNSDDMTIWVESIPFKETRKYVKNILEYQQVYANHLGVRLPTVTERLTGGYQAVR